MSEKTKKLINPFTSGGGGTHFEIHVQASFVVLMLTGGFVPCLPCWPITKIKLQGRFAGYKTDDLILFIKEPDSDQERKLLGQIKRTIRITEKDKIFGEVIQQAWEDFNNQEVFIKRKDKIALITGPLSATDINDVRTILEWARHSENSDEFFKKVETTNFSSKNKQKKLRAFETNLQNANNGNPIDKETFFEFLKHFYLLGYDLDIKQGVTLSLLHSMIGRYSTDDAQSVWTDIVDEVFSVNTNAGTILPNNLPEKLQQAFSKPNYKSIPSEFSLRKPPTTQLLLNKHTYANDLSIANLIGSWNEKSDADTHIIAQLANNDYNSWIENIREVLLLPGSPISLKNGKWHISNRESLLKDLGDRLFDIHLDKFQQAVVKVLKESDPKFDLDPDDRYAASIYGKELLHSNDLRIGMAECLALISNQSDSLENCSPGKAREIASQAVREILKESDWVTWGSLDRLLPTLAEAAPEQFFTMVENALQQDPCPFDELFSQEGNGLTGNNYLIGLLWSLEVLAWDKTYLTRSCAILGALASKDPGGNWTNRPLNSLRQILLPWLPQTLANSEKRKSVITILEREFPSVAWKLLLSLLPNQNQSSTGTHKPSWYTDIPDTHNKKISTKEYEEQISFYVERIISLTQTDIKKLCELTDNLDNFPKTSIKDILDNIAEQDFTKDYNEERLLIWTNISKLISKHKRFSDQDWAFSKETISKIEEIATLLAPRNLLDLNFRLFSDRDFELYEESDNWQLEQKKLEKKRQQVLREILKQGGVDAIITFSKKVESPSRVGYSLGAIATKEIDTNLLPIFLDKSDITSVQLMSNYLVSRHHYKMWEWADKLDKSGWSNKQIGQFLSNMPFTTETWGRATEWLNNSEYNYWNVANVNPYQAGTDLDIAITKLLEHNRPHAAINCLYKKIHDKNTIDSSQAIKALLDIPTSKEAISKIDAYHIIDVIKKIQQDEKTNPDDLFNVEWLYLPLLDRHRDASPIQLEKNLASDPSFFSELIRLVYIPKGKSKPKKEQAQTDETIITNAWNLLHHWDHPPGKQSNENFSVKEFTQWFEHVKKECAESGHLEVALNHIGEVLFYCPPDPSGLWINKDVAEILNKEDAKKIRDGFYSKIIGSRGVHSVDPTAKPERELAEQYLNKAEDIEIAGYQRLAKTLRDISVFYNYQADRIVIENDKFTNDQ